MMNYIIKRRKITTIQYQMLRLSQLNITGTKRNLMLKEIENSSSRKVLVGVNKLILVILIIHLRF